MNITVLPYRAPRRSRPIGQFSVVAPEEGLEVRQGSRTNNLRTALSRAAKVSEQLGYAIVQDATKPLGQNMIALYKKGLQRYVASEFESEAV